MARLPCPPRQPCGSCPYRCDVPSGIWHSSEYAKLSGYDGDTMEQSWSLFMCHQQDGRLCGGWLACHGTDHLLALRINRVDPSAYGYVSPVPVFGSGAEAAAHGLADIARPKAKAARVITAIDAKRRA